ncbi:MAG: hypothetical protein HWE39_25620 [Oceanospirillaceae bacterium]|nr:hypothetical protein [Oceanospirillaceae bacterium]
MKHSALIIFLMWTLRSVAQMQALSEEEMTDSIGQAFVKLEQYQQDGLKFSRLDFGLDVIVQLNADRLVLGEYPRLGENQAADIHFDNFALGHIEDGKIVPFEMKDPFIEWAYDDSSGRTQLTGLRFGFGDSKGKMSFDIKSLTGNIDVLLKGNYAADTWLGTFNVDAKSRANLVDANGNLDPIRATLVGVSNGTSFDAVAFGFIPISLPVDNCRVTGFGVNDNVCFSLANYKSLDVGEKKADGSFDFASGLFLSFQSRDMRWGDISKGESLVQTYKGAFFNIPNGSLTLTPEQALNGIPRAQTEFIDRGIGRF